MTICERRHKLEAEVARLRAIIEFGKLPSYEQAEQCLALSKEHLSGNEIAKRFGVNKAYVRKLITARKDLRKDIREAWRAGDALATTDRVVALSKKSEYDQMVEWKRIQSRVGDRLLPRAAPRPSPWRSQSPLVRPPPQR